MEAYLIFVAAAIAVVVAGSLLARFGDDLAEITGLGGLWIGAILVSLATSLPELATDISAARQHAPDLAVGDLLGSNMTNMAILAVVTIVFRSRRLLQSVALENILTATLAISVTGLAALFLISPSDFGIGLVGLGPAVIFAVYVLGSLALRQSQVEAGASRLVGQRAKPSLAVATAGFGICGLVILAAGPFLAESSNEIATETGLGLTFFGALALAMVTSLPELSVSIAGLRLGSVDLVLGNILGSCATNMALLLPVEIAYTDGRLLADADPAMAIAAIGAILLMTLGIAAIVLRAESRRLPVDPAAVLILVGYVAVMAGLYDASAK
jgi:cation:H+ antiporter